MDESTDSETLVQVILLLVAVWLVLGVVTELFDVVGRAVVLFPDVIGLVIVGLIVLWFLDYL